MHIERHCTVFHQVHKVFASGLAAEEGTIQKGDKIVSINGQMLQDVKHADATAAVRQARTSTVAVVVIDKSSAGKEAESVECRSEEPSAEGSKPLDNGTSELQPVVFSSYKDNSVIEQLNLVFYCKLTTCFHVSLHGYGYLFIVTTTNANTDNNNNTFNL